MKVTHTRCLWRKKPSDAWILAGKWVPAMPVMRRLLLILLAVLLLISAFLLLRWPVTQAGYGLVRAVVASLELARFRAAATDVLQDGSVEVLYRPGEAPAARLVAREATWSLPRLEARLAFHVPGTVVIELEDSEEAMAHDLLRASYMPVLGAYYEGVVHILAPGAWLPAERWSLLARAFWHSGPVPHELTHLLLDLETDGNLPSWYNEGVAQWEEERLTGYVWTSPAGDLARHRWYTFGQLDRFYALPNEALAYREALLFVQTLVAKEGEAGLARIDQRLGAGQSFPEALQDTYGWTLADLWRAARAAVFHESAGPAARSGEESLTDGAKKALATGKRDPAVWPLRGRAPHRGEAA